MTFAIFWKWRGILKKLPVSNVFSERWSDKFLGVSMNRQQSLLAVFVFIAMLAVSACGASGPESDASQDDSDVVVETRPGLLEGEWVEDSSGVRVFRGIPYAEAPIGERRWQPPAAVKPWQGTRAATEFGPACWQQPTPDSSVYTRGNLDRNEDCLYLNVWTAAEAVSYTHLTLPTKA